MAQHSLTRRQFGSGLMAGLAISPLPVAAPLRAAMPADADATGWMQAAYAATRHDSARFAATLINQPRADVRQVRALEGLARQLEAGRATARLMRFASPADMRGVATLSIERGINGGGGSDDLWIYLPALRRVRRLVAANRADPWAGSEFSLGDIAGHKVTDWRHRVLRRETIDGEPALLIESLPASPRIAGDSGYGRRLTWLRASDAATLRAEFHDLSGTPLKRLTGAQIQTLDATRGLVQPMQLTMRNLKSGGLSVLSFNQFRIGIAVNAADLAPEALAQ